MTTVKTNNNTKEYQNVKFLLTSNIRTKLILAIHGGPKNLEELRKELKKPSATILHGLKELENMNIVKKSGKTYELTSNGYLLAVNMIKLIDNWYSINKNQKFWDNHDLEDIPQDMLKKIYLLKDAEYVHSTTSDLANAFNKYVELISESKELHIYLPIYSENHFKHIIEVLNSDELEYLELIVNEDILNSIDKNKDIKAVLIKNDKIDVKCVERPLKLFITYSESFMSLSLFFKDGHYDDSQMLISKNSDGIKWAKEIFKLMKKQMRYYDKESLY